MSKQHIKIANFLQNNCSALSSRVQPLPTLWTRKVSPHGSAGSPRRLAPRRRHPSCFHCFEGFVVTATALSTVARDCGRAVRILRSLPFQTIACALPSIVVKPFQPAERSFLSLYDSTEPLRSSTKISGLFPDVTSHVCSTQTQNHIRDSKFRE